jgi:tripartite motif-containing protein 71
MKQQITTYFVRGLRRLASCLAILALLVTSLPANITNATPQPTDVPTLHSMINRFDPEAANGKFDDPKAMAFDSTGNIYVVDNDNLRVQKFDSNGNYLLKWGSEGTSNGEFGNPRSIGIDSSNNIYVGDIERDDIQKFDSNGNFISKFGSPGTGNGQFDGPYAIDFNSTGDIFVVDRDNHRVQRFDSSGNYISQFGDEGSGDGEFYEPSGIAIDSSNNIFVSDYDNSRVQKFSSAGTYDSQFGTNGSGDGELFEHNGLDIDSSGNIYVADSGNSRIQKFNSSGIFVAKWGANDGDGSAGEGDGEFDSPRDVKVGSNGNIYVVDEDNNRIQKLNSNGIYISQFGESGSIGIVGSNADGKFNAPRDMAQDSQGNIYVADGANNRIQKFTSSGVFIEAWGANGADGTNGTSNGEFNFPESIAIDGSDNIYVGEANNYRVQKLDKNGNFIAKWGANGGDGSSGSGDGEFSGIRGIAIALDGNLLVVDEGNYRIQKLNSTTGAFISKFGTSGNADGEFSAPAGVATDSSGNIYVADMYNNRIQKFSSDGIFISKWGANGGDSSSGSGDGEFSAVSAVDVDNQGNVYTLDYDNGRVQKFDTNGNFLAKWGDPGTGDGQFDSPEGLQVSANGNTVFVADSDNQRIQIFKYGPDEVGSDLNGDSIDDSTQPNIGGYVSPITGKVTAIDVGSTCELTTDDYVLENQLNAQDSAYDYESGLWDFEADCGTPGYITTIKLYYYDISPDGKVLRKHNPNTNAYFTINDANISTQNINGHTVTVVTYQVTDGGERDIDGIIDGLMKDPAGLAQAAIGAPNTGL